jgi:hypothetical protein
MKKIILLMICILLVEATYTSLSQPTENSIKPTINEIINVTDLNSNVKNPNNFESVEVIDQQQTSSCGNGCPFFSNIWLAQGFTPSLESLTRIELYLFKIGNPGNTIILSIRDSLTGTDLTSVSIDGSTIPEYGIWKDFDFSDISVVPGTMYYAVCRTSAGSVIDYYCCLFDINNPYADGNVWGSLNSGTTWSLIEYPGYPDPDGCFITYGLDEIPNIPKIDGEANGSAKTEYEYTFTTTDPEGHDVFYYIEWGDGKNSGWIGPFESSVVIKINHSWSKKGTYTIQCKAKDAYDAESDWGTFTLSIPKKKINLKIQSQGIFIAQLGSRGTQRAFLALNGSYHCRNRYVIVQGNAETGNSVGRYRGIFHGNHFVIKINLEGRPFTILGRCRFDENYQAFSGNWMGRMRPNKGWISGIFRNI